MYLDFRNSRLACGLVLGLLSTAALGQTRDGLLRCRAIAEDAPRLACYDALALPPAPGRGKYEPVALEDLSEAPLSFRGRLVEVTARIMSGQDGWTLSPGGPNGRELPLDLNALPRQQRESLRGGCATGCEATVQGRVAPVRFVTGIVADAVLLR